MARSSQKVRHKECQGLQVSADQNANYIKHCVAVGLLPRVSLQHPSEVIERCKLYFDMCIEANMKPTFAGFSLALGKTREYIQKSINGEYDVPPETRDFLTKCEGMMESLMEQYMINGDINPVAGIFLMRNNHGYTNDETLTVKAISDETVDKAALLAQAQALIEQKDTDE